MEKKDLRIVFMGTPEFAVGTLSKLVEGQQSRVPSRLLLSGRRGRLTGRQYSVQIQIQHLLKIFSIITSFSRVSK